MTIIGIDFLKNLDLLVDPRRNRPLNRGNSVMIKGVITDHVSMNLFVFKDKSDPYKSLLNEYAYLTSMSYDSSDLKHIV